MFESTQKQQNWTWICLGRSRSEFTEYGSYLESIIKERVVFGSDIMALNANVRMYGLVCTKINTALDVQSTARSKMIKDSDRLATDQRRTLTLKIIVRAYNGVTKTCQNLAKVLDQNVPHGSSHSVSDSVDTFFKKSHPDHYLYHQVVLSAFNDIARYPDQGGDNKKGVSDMVATIDAEPYAVTWIFNFQKESHTRKLVSIVTMKLMTRPNGVRLHETDMNNLESDDESVDTPLFSPFPHSDNDSDDGEVLNEMIEYENVGMLCRERAVMSHPISGGNTGCDDTIHRIRYKIIHFTIIKLEFTYILQVKKLDKLHFIKTIST
ncbi:hypothetical protein Tco_1300731 [Tanacetum coccineum]